MREKEELERLNTLREDIVQLRVLSARLEPVADNWVDRGGAKKTYLHAYRDDEVRAERAAWAEEELALGQLAAGAVQNLRQLAEDVDDILGRARGRLRGERSDGLRRVVRSTPRLLRRYRTGTSYGYAGPSASS